MMRLCAFAAGGCVRVRLLLLRARSCRLRCRWLRLPRVLAAAARAHAGCLRVRPLTRAHVRVRV